MTTVVPANVAADQTWRHNRRGPRIRTPTPPPDGGACAGDPWPFDQAAKALERPGPGRPGRHPRPEVAAALAICHSCPVATACLDWAIATGDRWSILGGTTPTDRGQLRKASA